MTTVPDLAALNPGNIFAFIGEVFDKQGANEYLGEPVTIGEHMLQGARLAENGGQDEETIVAALLHDVGHFTSAIGTFAMTDEEDRLHEEAGALLLERFFPRVIVDCVKYHVAAKRYLCAVKPEYFERLSEASVHSLKLQGGPMSADEVAGFEALPHHQKIVQVRYLDEAGKDPKMETPDFWYYAPMVQRIVDQHATATA